MNATPDPFFVLPIYWSVVAHQVLILFAVVLLILERFNDFMQVAIIWWLFLGVQVFVVYFFLFNLTTERDEDLVLGIVPNEFSIVYSIEIYFFIFWTIYVGFQSNSKTEKKDQKLDSRFGCQPFSSY